MSKTDKPFDFEKEYGTFKEFVDKCDSDQLKQCKAVVEDKIKIFSRERIQKYVEGLKKFDQQEQQEIRDLLNKNPDQPPPKRRREKDNLAKKPNGYVEVVHDEKQFWVPQLLNWENEEFFAAGSPNNKTWVGNYKEKKDKEATLAKYGAAIVLEQHPEMLKTLAEKKALYKQDANNFLLVSAAELE